MLSHMAGTDHKAVLLILAGIPKPPAFRFASRKPRKLAAIKEVTHR